MEPIDNELKKGLAEGPLGRQAGFSDNLKKRIEQRLEEQVKRRKPRMPWLAGAAATALAGLLLFGNWQSLLPLRDLDAAAPAAKEPPANVQAQAALDQAVQVRSALLLGLRTDQQGPQKGEEFSTYRTLLIAPDESRLQRIAEGPGILMPYKMSFWKIVNERLESDGQEARKLTAYLASSSKPAVRQPTAPPVKPMLMSEKLLFAGNRYMAVAQTLHDSSIKNNGSSYHYVWVKELDQLTAGERLSRAPLRKPHVSLRSLFGEAAVPVLKQLQPSLPMQPGDPPNAPADKDGAGESWAIVRKQGRWAAQLADYTAPAGPDASKVRRYELKDVPIELPESVVSHDRLAASWQEIKRLRPNATDAFSSPSEDMLAVVSERDIVIYPYQGGLLSTPLLTLSLGRNESVVMAQWATGSYVKQWKEQAKAYLQNE